MSKQNRVYEVARQFKVSSQAMIDVLQNLGYEIKSHMSPVNEVMLQAISDYFQGQKAEAIAEEARKKEVAEKRKALELAEKEGVAVVALRVAYVGCSIPAQPVDMELLEPKQGVVADVPEITLRENHVTHRTSPALTEQVEDMPHATEHEDRGGA